MKIYTKTGDRGQTGLLGGARAAKDDPRIEAYGTVDELNSTLGVARAESPPDDIDRLLAGVEHELFAIGAELARPEPAAPGGATIGAGHVEALEAAIDRYEAGLEPLKQFILPTGTKAAAALHFARSVCRRAERRLVTLAAAPRQEVSQHLMVYLNRLGDLLFVLARSVNAAANVPDTRWEKPEEM